MSLATRKANEELEEKAQCVICHEAPKNQCLLPWFVPWLSVHENRRFFLLPAAGTCVVVSAVRFAWRSQAPDAPCVAAASRTESQFSHDFFAAGFLHERFAIYFKKKT